MAITRFYHKTLSQDNGKNNALFVGFLSIRVSQLSGT
jgi:hypothetical protein